MKAGFLYKYQIFLLEIFKIEKIVNLVFCVFLECSVAEKPYISASSGVIVRSESLSMDFWDKIL